MAIYDRAFYNVYFPDGYIPTKFQVEYTQKLDKSVASLTRQTNSSYCFKKYIAFGPNSLSKG
jgi:hypothetical protein